MKRRFQVLYEDEFELEHETFIDAESTDELEAILDERGIDWVAYCEHFPDGTWGPWVYPWQ